MFVWKLVWLPRSTFGYPTVWLVLIGDVPLSLSSSSSAPPPVMPLFKKFLFSIIGPKFLFCLFANYLLVPFLSKIILPKMRSVFEMRQKQSGEIFVVRSSTDMGFMECERNSIYGLWYCFSFPKTLQQHPPHQQALQPHPQPIVFIPQFVRATFPLCKK